MATQHEDDDEDFFPAPTSEDPKELAKLLAEAQMAERLK
jgi:hypothetical protein